MAGIDEAGRGPWAGPVVAAAVVLDPDAVPEGLNDSKKLTAARREALLPRLERCVLRGLKMPPIALPRARRLALWRQIARHGFHDFGEEGFRKCYASPFVEDYDYVADYLRGEGYQVLEAADGLEALELERSYGDRIDVLVTDVVMPHVGGVELADRLKHSRPETEVVFVSGYARDLASRPSDTAALNFLQKPFRPDRLIETLASVLRSHALRG